MKKISVFIGIIVITLSVTLTAKAGYYYSYWGTPIDSVEPYTHVKTITPPEITHLVKVEDSDSESDGSNSESEEVYEDVPVEIGELADMFVHNGKTYLLDGKLNKIIVLDENYKFQEQFPKNAESDSLKMNGPKGIYVRDELNNKGDLKTYIYVADTGNGRILKLTDTWRKVDDFGTPNDLIFQGENAVDYKPEKIQVNNSGKMYVIATGVYEGILELDADGTFSRFVGTNKVAINILDRFWMMFMSKEQRDKISLYLPTTFLNFDIDEDGFLYTVSQTSDGSGNDMIKRLNTKGIDVLSRTGYFTPKGEVSYTWWSNSDVATGPSKLVDIAVNDYGLYSVLDVNRGRIFTYDFDGNLLYIFGGNGEQVGTFSNATTIKYMGDDLVVMDSTNNTISLFTPTKFGELVNEATKYYYEGDYDESAEVWDKTLKYNNNYYLAYRGIARTQYIEGDYKSAMENFKLANDKSNYSLAYKEYRNEQLKKYFPIVVVLIFGSVGVLLYSSIKDNIQQAKETGRD